MEDRAEEAAILAQAGVEGRVLQMRDGGQPVGYAVVSVKGEALHIGKISAKGYNFTEKPEGETAFVLDTLMRSAASYGEDHGATEIVVDFPDFFDFFRLRGFAVEEGLPHTPMETIVHYQRPGMDS